MALIENQVRTEIRRAAVFLDKDGTLIEDVPYNVDPAKIRLAECAPEGLRRLHAAGYLLVIVSNQSGVARGLFPERALRGVEARLRELLEEHDVTLDGFYYCPHHPSGIIRQYAIECNCRKPAPGLILRAEVDLNIDLTQSWFVGDILNDVEAGRRAGCRTVLINNGNETEWELAPQRIPDVVVTELSAAADVILGQQDPGIPLAIPRNSAAPENRTVEDSEHERTAV
jgi:D-glycero-D-manno-heptose 1,7-bisphosphate phosphatase